MYLPLVECYNSGGKDLNEEWPDLTPYTLTSKCIFSTLFRSHS